MLSYVRISSYDRTPFPWTNQSVAWCARDAYGMKVASLQTIEYFARVHDWLAMIPEEAKTNFLEFTAATCIRCTCSWRKSLLSPEHMLHERDMKIKLIKVSNTSIMFNMNHGGDKMLLMGSTATHQHFHITWLPSSCEHGDSIGQT